MAPPLSARTVSGFTSLQEIGGDLRYGLRMLRRTPGLTAIAVLSLAIGVGANSAIFSVIDSIVLRSLPVRDPEGLTIVQALTRQGNRTSLSHSDYDWLSEHNEVFSGLAASSARQLTRHRDARSERIQASLGRIPLASRIDPFSSGPLRRPSCRFGSRQTRPGHSRLSSGDCRTMIEAVEPNIAIRGMEPLWAAIDRTLGAERLAAGLSLGFGVIALLLTLIGLYGSLAYTVARRTGEIGIRMALGAQRSAILGMVAIDGLGLVLLGLVVGVGASSALASLTASLLYGVPHRDPTTFALASVTLIIVALIASHWPARRATNVDPTLALRSE